MTGEQNQSQTIDLSNLDRSGIRFLAFLFLVVVFSLAYADEEMGAWEKAKVYTLIVAVLLWLRFGQLQDRIAEIELSDPFPEGPPGSRFLRVTPVLFSESTHKNVFENAYGEMWEEYDAADTRVLRAWRLIQGYWGLLESTLRLIWEAVLWPFVALLELWHLLN